MITGCPEDLRREWPKLEADFLPLIEAKAKRIKRFAPGSHFDFDDAVQEGRIFLLEAFLKYDSNKGELSNFVGVMINNKFKTMLNKMLAYRRVPRSFIRDGEGWAEVVTPPLSLDYVDFVRDEETRTDRTTEHRELEAHVNLFNSNMMATLRGLNKYVFECLVNPPIEFLKMVQNIGGDLERPTCKQIAEFTGAKLNAVLWSVSYIRMKFTEMAQGEEYSELFGDLVKPLVHVKDSIHDTEFVRKTISRKKLNPKPVNGYSELEDFYQKTSDGTCVRMIERYTWGVVLVLKYEDENRTMVIEGKFSPLKGIVIGKNGMRERIPVPWYKDMVVRLRGEK